MHVFRSRRGRERGAAFSDLLELRMFLLGNLWLETSVLSMLSWKMLSKDQLRQQREKGSNSKGVPTCGPRFRCEVGDGPSATMSREPGELRLGEHGIRGGVRAGRPTSHLKDHFSFQ